MRAMAIRRRIRVWRGGGMVLTVAAIAVSSTGCAKSPPPAAEVALTHDPSETAYARILSPQDRQHVVAAFNSLTINHAPIQRPQAAGEATYGQRWEDVYAAVLFACDEVEMAVVGKTEVKVGANNRDTVGWTFRVRTVEDWPGTLTIQRIALSPDSSGPQRVYEAQASIGEFGDRTARAEALLAALDHQMTAFGRKPRMPQ